MDNQAFVKALSVNDTKQLVKALLASLSLDDRAEVVAEETATVFYLYKQEGLERENEYL